MVSMDIDTAAPATGSAQCSYYLLALSSCKFAPINTTNPAIGAQYASSCAANIIAYENVEYLLGPTTTCTEFVELVLTLTTEDQYHSTFWLPTQCNGST